MNISYHNEQLQNLERLKDDTHHALRIALCGKFKSGKTSLLNLLLGTALPVQAVTATGIVTKVIYGRSYAVKRNDGSITPVSSEELNRLITVAEKTLDGITFGDAQTAYIGSRSKLLKRGKVEFWDTPGLEDDPVLTAIAMNAVKACDLVICVMNATQLLSLHEKRLFSKLFALMNGNMIFVVNHIDSLHGEERNQVLDTVKKSLKQYPNRYCENGNIFFTSANPNQPDIASLRDTVVKLVNSKSTRLEIQKTTKIGKSNVLMQEWNDRILEDRESIEQSILESQSQIQKDVQKKQAALDEQYKYCSRDIEEVRDSICSKLQSELTWRNTLEEYQSELDWERNFKQGAAAWIKNAIQQIINDTNCIVSESIRTCSFYKGDFAIFIDEKIWKKHYVYQKNFVRPLLFPERRFRQYCSDCIDKTIPMLMSHVIPQVSSQADIAIENVLKNLASAYTTVRENLTAEQCFLDSYQRSQMELQQMNDFVARSEKLCQDISIDRERGTFRYKLKDFLCSIFPSMFSGEIY